MSKIIGDDIDEMVKVLENIRMALHEHREYLELPDIGNSFQIVNTVNRALTAARNLSLELSNYKKASHGIVMIERKPVKKKSCDHACSPSDYYEGGKCDKMGCYQKKAEDLNGPVF